jgi:hypothetical protein
MFLIFDQVLAFLLIGVLRSFQSWRRRAAVRRAQNWPKIRGLGLWAQAESTKITSRAIWSAEISYNFVVDGEYYSGFASLPAEDEGHAEGLALGWKDREILVRYRPGRPMESTLLLEDQEQPLASTQNA